MAKEPKIPKKTQGHSAAASIKDLLRRVDHLEARDRHLSHTLEHLQMTIADLKTALTALEQTIANLPASTAPVATQADIDEATSRVTAATAALASKAPPTP